MYAPCNRSAQPTLALLEAVNRGEFLLNGFGNRDLRAHLYTTASTDSAEDRRRSAAVTRKLRMLPAHGLIQKVPKSHRYQVSERGRTIIAALLAATCQHGEADRSRLIPIHAAQLQSGICLKNLVAPAKKIEDIGKEQTPPETAGIRFKGHPGTGAIDSPAQNVRRESLSGAQTGAYCRLPKLC